MLREVFAWLSTPCSPAARKLGYLKEAIALESRARRCQAAWHEHLAHCHQAVRDSLARCARHRTALIVGSGLALEYPLAELAARFERVILADIVHLRCVRRRARPHANVELIACDATGLADALLSLPRDADRDSLDALMPQPPFADLTELDWVLSCNLLSQLPLLPSAWIERRCPQIGASDRDDWAHRLMAAHIEWLQSLPAERCLIADAEQTTRASDGSVVAHADYARPLALDDHAYATWEWQIAPRGELPAAMSASHRVVACRYA